MITAGLIRLRARGVFYMKDNENSIEKGYFDMYNYFEYSELVLYNVTKNDVSLC